MKIIVTGGTGFIGSELCVRLLREGHILTIITRTPDRYESESAQNQQFIGWDFHLPAYMEQADVVINLVGENLFGQRWTDEVKKRIYSSRIDNTHKLVEAMKQADNPPELLISASGIDYYRNGGDDVQSEEYPAGDDFLGRLCIDWEKAALSARDAGVRVAVARQGVVLGKGGGALQQMLTPFRFFVGGPIGSGRQYFSWIHMHDLCRGLLYPVENKSFDGIYNLSSPNPVPMKEFARVLGEVMNRPSLLRVPEFAVRLALGEAANPVLGSHRVQPRRLQQEGFTFEFNDLHEALSDIL